MLTNRTIASLCVLTLLATTAASRADVRLQVHEWGTFTALQDESGEALPGINIDDEPLPVFCHNLHPWALNPSTIARNSIMMKGVPERHPYVTLRLETPVLYFHPPAGAAPFSIDVNVEFRGGWLTEFYPHAVPDEPGLKFNEFDFGPITADTVGSLAWNKVEVGTPGAGPATDENVWLAPRNVNAATVTVPPQTDKDTAAETEKFLFYRGVANRPAPLRMIDDQATDLLSIKGQCADVLAKGQQARIASLWLVDVRDDGSVAWRTLESIMLTPDMSSTLATTSAKFADSEYSASHLETLRSRMHAALVSDGLNEDEATAMLNTWKRVYFQCPGLRVFYLVPRAWTDAVLPLKLSQPAEVKRVMMGRIELISPRQRQLLKKLSTIHVSNPEWLDKVARTPAGIKFFQGRSSFGDLGVKVPDDYQAYLELGRFRNALVLAELKARQTPQLIEFIHTYGLYAYQPTAGSE